MKAIFPDSKSLQPMPTPDVHANISGNTNNNTVVTPDNYGTTQNISNTPNNNTVVPPANAKNISAIFYFIAFMIIVVIIIITHKRLKRK